MRRRRRRPRKCRRVLSWPIEERHEGLTRTCHRQIVQGLVNCERHWFMHGISASRGAAGGRWQYRNQRSQRQRRATYRAAARRQSQAWLLGSKTHANLKRQRWWYVGLMRNDLITDADGPWFSRHLVDVNRSPADAWPPSSRTSSRLWHGWAANDVGVSPPQIQTPKVCLFNL